MHKYVGAHNSQNMKNEASDLLFCNIISFYAYMVHLYDAHKED